MRYFILNFILFSTLGCSSAFYYPTQEVHFHPSKIKLSPEEVTFKNEDGALLHGWYFTHTSSVKKPKAVIVYFHGNGQNISSHYMNFVWILKHGYDFFIFDYQGYGESPGKPSQTGTVKDGKAALLWVRDHKPNIPMVVFGQSLGGAVALRVAGELREQVPFKLVVVDGTFYSYKAVARKVLARSWLTWILQPLSYILLTDKESPEEYIPKISPVPLLVIHGDQDPIVPFELGEKVFALAKEPKEFWRVEGGSHGDLFWREEEIYQGKFLKKLKSLGL